MDNTEKNSSGFVERTEQKWLEYTRKRVRLRLFYPGTYPDSPEASKGRCGPGDGLLEKLVPDTIYGLDVREACKIHDHMYRVGPPSIDGKKEADRVFFNNLVRIIDYNTSNWLLLRLRLRRAKTYYSFVKDFGGPSYWHGKNEQPGL